MIAPDRIAEVHFAGIGGRAHHAANKAASKRAHGRIARHSAYRRAACPADQGPAYSTLSGIGAATGKEHHNREASKRKCDAHGISPLIRH
jgi:hypothetical protein